MVDQVVRYDNIASGPFVVGTNITWAGGGIGEVVTVVSETADAGKIYYARLAGGDGPQDGEVITQGGTTADANTNAEDLLYPIFARPDLDVAANGDITWDSGAPDLGVTHSHFFDGQTSNFIVGEILTYSGGQTAEVIQIISDAGVSGEVGVRMITPTDQGLPQDNDTFTGDVAGDGTVDGIVHERTYRPIHIHRLLSDLNDDEVAGGDDFLSAVDPTASNRSTDEIVQLLGTVNITDEVAQHMYGGSISQASGDTLYSGLNLQVTSPLASTRPVLIQDDAIITDYWNNAYNPDSIAGNIRIMVKTREDAVDFDGKRIKGKLLEFGEFYFEGSTTLGTATTALALFSSGDGNNNTAVGTVAGAPYNTIVVTEGFQTIDFNNGNGAQPFGLSIDFGSATSLQTYERTKYIQRRGTAETLFGRNAQLVTGINRNFPYDAEASGPFQEDELIAWGDEIPYTGETSGPFTVGNVLEDDVTGARGRILYLDDQGTTGTMIVAKDGTTAFGNTNGLTEYSGGVATGTTATSGTAVTNTNAGTGLLIALDDDGSTGNLYYQGLTGLDPVDDQTVFGQTSLATADVNQASGASFRTINNQFVGGYTGTNFQTNFGIAIDDTDAIAGDAFPDLLGATQNPPDNQSGTVGNLVIGDRVMVFPWDGSSTDVNGDAEPDFDNLGLAVALIAATSTVVDVGTGNIPDNTPQTGVLRVARDSDGQFEHLPYASHDGDDEFTLVGTAPSAAAISNNVFVGGLDQIATATSHSYTAVYSGTPTNHVIIVRRGGVSPIKPSIQTASFGAAGFSVNAARTPDS